MGTHDTHPSKLALEGTTTIPACNPWIGSWAVWPVPSIAWSCVLLVTGPITKDFLQRLLFFPSDFSPSQKPTQWLESLSEGLLESLISFHRGALPSSLRLNSEAMAQSRTLCGYCLSSLSGFEGIYECLCCNMYVFTSVGHFHPLNVLGAHWRAFWVTPFFCFRCEKLFASNLWAFNSELTFERSSTSATFRG